jgi:hypothetical protein
MTGRLAAQRLANLLLDELKLGIAIRMGGALLQFPVRLQAVAHAAQHLRDRLVTDGVAFLREGGRERARTLTGPPQRGFRITAAQRLDQGVEAVRQVRIVQFQQPSPTTGPPDTARRQRCVVQFSQALRDGDARQATGATHDGDPAPAELPGFTRGEEPAGPLVQMGPQLCDLLGESTGTCHPTNLYPPYRPVNVIF